MSANVQLLSKIIKIVHKNKIAIIKVWWFHVGHLADRIVVTLSS